MPTFTKQSARWLIYNAIASALEGAEQLQGVAFARNPRAAKQLASGERLIVTRWGSDSPIDLKGSIERRRFRLIVGSISRKRENADQDADALHQAATEIVRKTLPTLTAIGGIDRIGAIRESDTTPDLEGSEVDGALVLSSWEFDYQQRLAD